MSENRVFRLHLFCHATVSDSKNSVTKMKCSDDIFVYTAVTELKMCLQRLGFQTLFLCSYCCYGAKNLVTKIKFSDDIYLAIPLLRNLKLWLNHS